MTAGRALLAALLEACLDAGVEVRPGARVTELPADGPVVLASGGFDRDPQLVKAFLRGPMLAPTGAPGLVGDGLRLAMAAGAALGTMSEAWWCPATSIPGETIDGEPLYRLLLSERTRPRCLMVDRSGRRFVNEAQNYNDLGRALQNFEPASFSYPHVPAWLVFDGGYRRQFPLGPLAPDAPDPDWLERAPSVAALAEAIGVPAAELDATVARFNEGAARGDDPELGRGSTPYDRFIGGLGPLDEAPYYALRVLPGCLGTKGGPRTDSHGRVLSVATGEPIPRLYAAGNAAASPFGLAYPGAGGTLGPALVFGLRAGRAAAEDG
jgi:succinate dehydrogenase/fumarate reductase flavoprotein subunit